MLRDCTVTFNGKEFNVTKLDIDYGASHLPIISMEGYLPGSTSGNLNLHVDRNNIEAIDKLINEVENEMGYSDEKACADDGYYEPRTESRDVTKLDGNSLARKFAELDLSEEERTLRKHGIVNLDGTLTVKGKNFLINVLFADNYDRIVEALETVEESEEPTEE